MAKTDYAVELLKQRGIVSKDDTNPTTISHGFYIKEVQKLTRSPLLNYYDQLLKKANNQADRDEIDERFVASASVALQEYLHSNLSSKKNPNVVSDYYETLKLSPNATQQQIKEAYEQLKAERKGELKKEADEVKYELRNAQRHHYQKLGVSEDASQEEIEEAYNRLLEDKNPDKIEAELRAKGASEKEIQKSRYEAQVQIFELGRAFEATSSPDKKYLVTIVNGKEITPADEAKKPTSETDITQQKLSKQEQQELEAENLRIEAAYATLSNSKNKRDYDSVYKKQYNEKWKKAQEEKGEESGISGFTIKGIPSSPPGNAARDKKIADFRNSILSSGAISLDAKDIENLRFRGQLPANFSNSAISAGLILTAFGHTPESIYDLAFDKNLNNKTKEYLIQAAIVMKSMRDANLNGSPNFDRLNQASGRPSSELIFDTAANNENSLEFKIDGDNIAPVFTNYNGQIVDLQSTPLSGGAERIKNLVSRSMARNGKSTTESLGLMVSKLSGGEAAGKGLSISLASFLGKIGSSVFSMLSLGLNWLLGQFWQHKEEFGGGGLLALGLGAAYGNSVLMFLGGTAAMGVVAAGGFAALTAGIGGAIAFALAAPWAVGIGIAGTTMIIVFLLFSLFVALVLLIINSGGYVTPYWQSTVQAGVNNPYIAVAAIGGSPNIDNPTGDQTISYTFTITAKAETLTNFSAPEFKCSVSSVTGSINCPTPSNIPNLSGLTLNPGETHSFTYSLTYNPSHSDSLALNSITISADAVSQKSVQESASASTCIGTCPQDCPSIWPTDHGRITQGSNTTSSHEGAQAIDVGGVGDGAKVYATHGGVVEFVDNPSCEGNITMIKSTCNGKEFKSRYSHLLTRNVLPGTRVEKGQFIGTTNNSGSSACSTGSHLHYQLIGLPMSSPWIPENVQPVQNCCTDCGIACTTRW